MRVAARGKRVKVGYTPKWAQVKHIFLMSVVSPSSWLLVISHTTCFITTISNPNLYQVTNLNAYSNKLVAPSLREGQKLKFSKKLESSQAYLEHKITNIIALLSTTSTAVTSSVLRTLNWVRKKKGKRRHLKGSQRRGIPLPGMDTRCHMHRKHQHYH